MRDGLLTIHILAAAAWIGGGLFATVSFTRLAESIGLKRLAALDNAIGTKFFGTSVVLVLLSGVGLVLTEDSFGWTDAFVLIGIAVIVIDGILEGVIFGPALKRLSEADEEDPAAFSRKLTQSGVIHLVLLAFAVWAMVSKIGVG